MLLQLPLSAARVRIWLSIGSATDWRINFVNKLIQGIQTIKNYVWEEPIIHNIQRSRRVECRALLKLYLWNGFIDGMYRNTNMLLAFPIVLVPLAEGRTLVASTVFTALSLVDSLTLNIGYFNFGMNAALGYHSVSKD